jgi:hypothetical protein
MSNNPEPETNETIESLYAKRLNGLGIAGRFRRVCEMHRFGVRMLMDQLRATDPNASDEELRFRVMERMYRSDGRTLSLIAQARSAKVERVA